MDTLTGRHTPDNMDLPSDLCFPDEFPYEFGSPAESILGSTESETDQDELIAGLTRQLKTHNISQNHDKVWGLSASPQSTLTAAGCWSGSGSPNGPSQAPSPPTTPYASKEDSWDLVYAAAGQLKDQGYAIPSRNFASAYPSPVPKPTNTGVFLNSHCFPQVPPPQTNQFQSSVWGREAIEAWPSRQQIHHQNRVSNSPSEIGKTWRQLGFSQSAWPPLQTERQLGQNPPPPPSAQGGFTLRSIPVGRSDSGVKRECAGTGVFLPRRFVNLNEPRNKTGPNPTNLNSTTNFQNQAHGNGGLAPNYNAIMARRKEVLAGQQRRSMIQDNEIRLPQEWTY
jgi:hypothetical protein